MVLIDIFLTIETSYGSIFIWYFIIIFIYIFWDAYEFSLFDPMVLIDIFLTIETSYNNFSWSSWMFGDWWNKLGHQTFTYLALLVETSRAYAIPRCMSVRLSGRLSVCKQFLLPHLLWGFLSQRLLYSPSLLALWCSCAPAIIIMILSPGA